MVLERYHRSDSLKWNALALRKAITALKVLPYTVTCSKQALHIRGNLRILHACVLVLMHHTRIGNSIPAKIEEILTTGSLSRINNATREHVVSLFTDIWGVYPLCGTYLTHLQELDRLLRNVGTTWE